MSILKALMALLITLTFSLPGSAEESNKLSKAVFAGGCFWCMEPPFDELDGVVSTISGYAGGHVKSPTYRQVTAGGTGHYEAVQITYDPTRVSYETLLAVFWRNVDPFDAGGQFCDRGGSYRTAILVMSDIERDLANQSKAGVQADFETEIVTPVVQLAADNFYPAEGYHQDYYLKNPIRYKFYRKSCGRDRRLKDVWGS